VQSARPDSTCAWPPLTSDSLDKGAPSKHSTREAAEFAEDLAIRYADACCGPHSGHFAGMTEYGRKRDECMATLFQIVASDHGVSPDQVRQSLSERPKMFDLAVIASFGMLYLTTVYFVERRLWKVYSRTGDRQRGVMMTIYLSVMTSALGMLLLPDIWATTMENIRIGNGHLSYRGARIPWQYHRPAIFLCGVVLFCAVATLRYRAEFPPKRPS
jgi:hypothetical protein